MTTPYVQRYITFSTPWQGHEAAALGVKHAPAVIPAWIDMQTRSDFVKTLLNQTLRENVEHCLIFGYKGNNALYLPASNDGNVSLYFQVGDWLVN